MHIKWLPANLVALFITLGLVAVLSALVATKLLHNVALEENSNRLAIAAETQANFISLLSNTLQHPESLVGVLSRLDYVDGFGETGEFVIGRKDGGRIQILASTRFTQQGRPKTVDVHSHLAEPMRLAIGNFTGVIHGLDYRGHEVYAAYHPVEGTNLGVVAKIDADEVNAPYVRSFVIGVLAALLLAAAGGAVVFALNRSIIVELMKSRTTISNAFEGIILSLARMLDQRDPYTGGHQKRVADIACQVARAMKLNPQRVMGVRIGAMVHDIGKIGVPAELLSRPGKLDEAEMSVIRRHPIIGQNIVKGVDMPWPVEDIILQHHERLDGSGYPRGLSGDEICLEARIVSVCDVLEAITSHRPYRPSKSLAEGLSFLEQHKGAWFDDRVVDTLSELVKSGKLDHLIGTTA